MLLSPHLRHFSSFTNFCKKFSNIMIRGDCLQTPCHNQQNNTFRHQLINLEEPLVFAQGTLQGSYKHNLSRAHHLYKYIPCVDSRSQVVDSGVPVLQQEDDSNQNDLWTPTHFDCTKMQLSLKPVWAFMIHATWKWWKHTMCLICAPQARLCTPKDLRHVHFIP